MKIAEMEEGHKAGDNVFKRQQGVRTSCQKFNFVQKPSSPFRKQSIMKCLLIETFTYLSKLESKIKTESSVYRNVDCQGCIEISSH